MSQCQQILQVLSDGREHEMRDIHRQVGFCRLTSRVAELRSRGHDIVCRRSGGSYFYRLVLNEAVGVGDSPLPSTASLSTSAPNPASLAAARVDVDKATGEAFCPSCGRSFKVSW